MIYVLLQYWIFVALAFTLGLFVGWATCGGGEDRNRSNWLAWAVAAFLAGLFLAGFKWIPGLLGHLLEVALLLFAAYIIGCLTGCGCRQAAGGEGAHGPDGGHGAGHDAHGHGHADAAPHGSSAQAQASGPAAGAVASAPVALAEAAPSTAAPGPVANAATPAASTPEPAAPLAVAQSAARPDATLEATSGSAALPVASSGAAAPDAPAPNASPSVAAAAPAITRAGMTDGQRSILAAKEKLALQRAKATPAGASPGAADSAEAAPAPASAPAVLFSQGAPTLRPGMTDGQRSIIAARQKMAEKAAKAAAPVAPAETSAARAEAGSAEGARPEPESHPDARPDDLKLIRGVGPKNEAALNGLGVRRFSDIADWSRDNEKWVGHFIKFPGRIEREHWVAQARLLAAGIETPHAAAVKAGAVRIDDSADAPLSEAEAAQLARALPRQAPKVEDEHAHPGARPLGLAAPSTGKADDLKLIKGIGRQNEERLHALGVWRFEQIAAWTPANVKWIGSYLAFAGRIDREGWIEQAVRLARGELTEFARRVEAGDVPTSSSAPPRDAALI